MYKYIVVDDEVLIRRGMLKKIRAADFGDRLAYAGEADNGEDALELIRSVNPDIIITDMRMPEMDGKLLLQTLQKDYPDKKVIVVSGYSDFEYMKEAISAKAVGYLLKPFSRDEIRDTLTKAISILDAEQSALQQLAHQENEKQEISYDVDLQSLGNLILGLHHKEKAPVLRSSKLREVAGAKHYLLMTIYSTDILNSSSLSAGDHYVYIPHAQNDHMSFYLFYMSGESEGILEYAKSVAERIAGNASNNPKFGISGPKTSLIQLSEAYEETVEALNGGRIGEDNSAISVFCGTKSVTPALSWERMDELLFFIESGNSAKATEWTGKLFDHFYGLPESTLGEVKSTCRLLIQEVRSLLHRNFHIDGNASPSSSFESALSGIFDIEAIKAHLLTVLPNIAEMMNEQNVYSSEHVVDNIRSYIRNNYNKVLTLEKISSLFFINPSYCSYLFKEKTGVNFSDYVNQVRIDNAKAYLENTDDKVYKIAKTLGFDNSKYFFRVFKKLTGQTPEEYRQTIAKQKEQA
ncbi:response regulator transcription factor [Cohnella herbarum]|uniref:Response regulator n=1 Tax=Cohnella herbarum TaxID=2728023 RepID=A0A7Z2VMF7_9BACL|nr:response regulator [Cohnella herbarum]QJD85712.1 response regulator [Cohnella herbarum]